MTILKDNITGHASGTAYVQFLTSTQAAAALALTGSALLQRPITVAPKPPKPALSHMSSFQHPSPRIAAAPFDPFGFQLSETQHSANHHSGRGAWTPRGRGRGRSWRGINSSRGGRGIATGGRGSEQNKSNVYIRPGLEQQSK